MHLTLKASIQNKATVEKAFEPLNAFFDAVANDLPVRVEEIVSDVIYSIFESEGYNSSWDDLALSTQRERSRLGYDPEHPILVREGTYRESFIDFDSPYYAVEHEASSPHSYVHRIGTSNPLFPFHELASRISPRPATPLGDVNVYYMIVEEIQEYLATLLKEVQDA